MANIFVEELNAKLELSDVERRALESAGIRSAEELLALVWNFPSLSDIGVSLPKLSNAARRLSPSESFLVAATASGAAAGTPPSFAFGANYKTGAAGKPNAKVPIGSGGSSGPPKPPAGSVQYSLPNWPVRDQGNRGTCTAFAITACREYMLASADQKSFPQFSPQFLYWATKQIDGLSAQDGSFIEYAHLALANPGVCEEHHWPYSGHARRKNITHAKTKAPKAPSDAACHDAQSWRWTAQDYTVGPLNGGGAQLVLKALMTSQRPVAISVPVFKDSWQPNSNNWNTQFGIQYGHVIDPPISAVVDTGHAFCVTGFVTDPSAPGGGWFIFRNSWGNRWGKLPGQKSNIPHVGYGEISADYVDKYLWELCRL